MPRKRNARGYIAPVLPQGPARLAVKIRPPKPEYDNSVEAAGDDTQPKPNTATPLDDDEFAALVRTAITAAKDFDQNQCQPSRLEAWKFHDGDVSSRLEVNEGGSSVVSYDVRDAVGAIMPSMMEVFMSGDDIGEFKPRNAAEAEWAPLATAYVSALIREKLGDIELRAAIHTAFMSRVGRVAWWWDEGTRVRTQSYSGLDEFAFAQATDPVDDETTVDIVEREDKEIPVSAEENEAYQVAFQRWQQMSLMAQQQGQPLPPEIQQPQPPQPQKVIDCVVKYTTTRKELRMGAVPPEERLMDPHARTASSARFQGQRRNYRVWQLVNMGYDRQLCIDNATAEEPESTSMDSATREPENVQETDDDLPGDDNKVCELCTIYIYADRDGDGVAELLKVCTLGNAYKVAHVEEVDYVRGAEFQAIPRPHTATGDSLATNVADIQIMKTALLRGLMESLPHSIYPRYAAVEGKVNWDDLLSTLPGQPVRVKDPQAVTPLTVPFVGAAATEVSTWIDDSIKEPRIGVSKAAQGLDADALQSTPGSVAQAMVNAAQSQLRDFARCLAATGWRDLMKGILREVVTHQREPEWVKINGGWKQVDPRPWNADLEFELDPAFGPGTKATQIAIMQGIAATQSEAMKSLGPKNPLVNFQNLYATQRRICILAGIKTPELYWTDPSKQPEYSPPNAGGDPAADQAKAIAEAEVQKAKIQDDTKRYQLQLEDDRARDKNEAQVAIEIIKIAASAATPLPVEQLILTIIQQMRQPRAPETLPAPPNPQVSQQPALAGPG